MQQQKFSMPLVSLLPAGLGILAFYAFFSIFNLLRFAHCPSWTFFQSPPVVEFRIAGAFGDQVYLRSADGATYCDREGRWEKCSLPSYLPSQKEAPGWFVSRLFTIPENAPVQQLIRTGGYSQVTYYALLEDGQVWACPVDLETEINNMARSASALFLLLPLGLGIFSVIWFFGIFTREGEPMLWDVFGRGWRVK
jgi:hypothetical protein